MSIFSSSATSSVSPAEADVRTATRRTGARAAWKEAPVRSWRGSALGAAVDIWAAEAIVSKDVKG
jgi:hypothetical protein